MVHKGAGVRAEREKLEECKDTFDDCDAFDSCGASLHTTDELDTGTAFDNDGAMLDSRKL